MTLALIEHERLMVAHGDGDVSAVVLDHGFSENHTAVSAIVDVDRFRRGLVTPTRAERLAEVPLLAQPEVAEVVGVVHSSR